MAALAAFQAAFLEAVLAPEAPAGMPLAMQPGFAVYRNTVLSGCIDALIANFPSVHAQLGEQRFRDAARAFVHEVPPRDGVLAAYGAGFAAWLDARADGELRAAAALAALDRCWTESHLAAEAPVLDPVALAALAPERFVAGRLVPHPATRWLRLATPAFADWLRWREPHGTDHGGPEPHDVEGALLTRPTGAVTWHAIPAGAAAFLSLCRDGRPVASALDAVVDAGLDADLASWLPVLMHARAFTRFDFEEEGR